jgi:hypothetical protein
VNKEEKRLLKWLEEQMIHDCTFAAHPFEPSLEYCQFCGKMREVNRER